MKATETGGTTMTTATAFPPTTEQARIRDLFSTGQNVVIQAGAGTGKTSTLLLLAHSTERQGQYIAFNRSIVTEAARKFPKNVACATAHSLAMRAVGQQFRTRMDSGKRMRTIEIANRLKIDGLTIRDSEGNMKQLSRGFLASHVMDGVKRFCQSADDTPTLWHMPYIEGLDAPNADGTGHRRGVNNKQVAKHLEPALKDAWADLSSTEGALPFTTSTAFAVILKLWQLSKPRIGADFILYDEAQDASPVMLDIVLQQTHAQLVFVGDSQQQIYRFTGAIDALAKLEATGTSETGFLTQSFRFGPAVADVANHVLAQIEGAALRLIGTDTIASIVAPIIQPDAVLCRTNAAAVETVLAALDNETKVHLVGGGADVVAFARAARDLMSGKRTEHPELACFEDWAEVQQYVAQDEQGGDLRLLVTLIDKFTVEVILGALANQATEDDADLIVSTAHKSKGREWDRVQLAGDFPEDKLAGNADELRLLYVAVTRARLELDITAIPFLRDGYTPVVQAPVAVTAEAPVEAEAQVEVIETKPSEWVGQRGDRVEATVYVERSVPLPNAKFGPTFLCTMVDTTSGAIFKAFVKAGLDEGTTITISANVSKHDTYEGDKVTTVNYLTVVGEA